LSKRNFRILVIVLFSILILLVAKGIFKGNHKEKDKLNTLDLKTQYEYIKESGKASLIIFSYDTDCCENTKKFFNEYNDRAKKLIKDYEDKLEPLFINAAELEEKDRELLISIAEENEVQSLPFILIMDEEGKCVQVIQETFDNKEIRKIIDGLVK
jgi:thioredoxin-related protein